MIFANESPRYLAQTTPEKAHAVLAKLRGLPMDHPYVLNEMGDINRVLEEEKALSSGASYFSLLKEAWTGRSNRRRSFLCITLMMWSNLSGTNAMTYYSPTIFASVGLSGASVGLFATGIYGIVKIVACAVFIVFVTDSLGRRKSLLWTGVAQVSSRLRTLGTWFHSLTVQSGSLPVLCWILRSFRYTCGQRANHCGWICRDHHDLLLCRRVPIWVGPSGLVSRFCELSFVRRNLAKIC